MRTFKWREACALLIVTFAAAEARASDVFPHQIATTLGLAADPPCTICHRDLNGGTGTVVKPFGKTMQGFGLRAGDVASLVSALQESERTHADSDGDGVSDIDELKRGKDPNDPDDEPVLSQDGGADAAPIIVTTPIIPEPEYGCSVGGRTRRGDAGLLSTIIALGMRRRRRRRCR